MAVIEMQFLANDYETIYRSPDGKKIFPYTPGICVLESGRYVFTNDLGGTETKTLPEMAQITPNPNGGRAHIGQIFTSDDKGNTWQRRAVRNFTHARPFVAGGVVYVLGHAGDLVIYRSDDGGETWDEGHYFTKGETWHQSACNVWKENGYITLVMEQRFHKEDEENLLAAGYDWSVSKLAPVVMRAKMTDDLTVKENWTFSNAVRFSDVINEDELELFGMPFFHTNWNSTKLIDENDPTFRTHRLGWLEANIVRITDPAHYWYDPTGKTFHLFMRGHTAGTGYCMMMKAVLGEENGKETITVMPETNPSGRKVIFLPMPGGQMRFHIVWDEKTRLYWLLSTQAVDSMTRMEMLSDERYNIPCDERQRLQLSFSKNMVDWCFAGIVAAGNSEKQSRHYASMEIDGDDLVIVSRSGDQEASSAHDGNLSTFHKVTNFRSLVY